MSDDKTPTAIANGAFDDHPFAVSKTGGLLRIAGSLELCASPN
jgi:hypothetical protein